jgi:hypothetical protein
MSVKGVSSGAGVQAPRKDGQAADTKAIPKNKGIDVGIVKTTGPIGDVQADFEQFLAFVRKERPDRPATNGTTRLNELLGESGGSPQLRVLRAYNHAMNETVVRERFLEQNVTPTDEQVAEEVAILDEQSDWEILQTLSAAEQGGTLGKAGKAAGVIYSGFDLSAIQFAEVAAAGDIPLLPEDVASLTDAECTEVVDALLGGPDGGGAELATERNRLRKENPTALAQFDRGLLATLGSTLMAAYNDPQYAAELGIKFPTEEQIADQESAGGGIPEKYKGNILMMLAYVFATQDQDLNKVIEEYAEEYNDMNQELSKSDKGDNALENSISGQQMRLKAVMSMKETNASMGASLIDSAGAAQKRIWG